MTTDQRHTQPEPQRIEVAPDIYALLMNRHYTLVYPFDREANKLVARWKTAVWDPLEKGYLMDAHRPDLVRKALEEILDLRNTKGLEGDRERTRGKAEMARIAIDAGMEVAEGYLIETKKGSLIVERLGEPFLSKFGRNPKRVRFAYGHFATEAELAQRAQREAEPDLSL